MLRLLVIACVIFSAFILRSTSSSRVSSWLFLTFLAYWDFQSSPGE